MTSTPPPSTSRARGWRARTAAAALAVLPALVLAAGAQGADAPQGTLMAELGRTTTPAAASAVAQRTGLRHVGTLPEIGWAAYEYSGDRLSAHDALRSDPAVVRIDFTRVGEELAQQQEPDTPWTGPTPADPWPGLTPNDTIWGRSWVNSFTPGQPALRAHFTAPWSDNGVPQPEAWAFWHWTFANFTTAWTITQGSPTVPIAIIDGEFATDHPDLAAKFRPGMNFDSGSPQHLTTDVRWQSGEDPDGFHGSHVAGIAGAQGNNSFGTTGACWQCPLVPYKIGFGGGDGDAKFIFDLTRAITAVADSDARVISMSVGTRTDHAPLRDAIAYAAARGKVMVASAGNSQLSEPNIANFPSHYPDVIAVAASTPADSIADFSLHNANVDIAAPGHPIVSTTDARDPKFEFNQGYRALSGTSMATPMVAGLAALMISVRPDLSPAEVEALIKGAARDKGTPGPDPVYGAGIIDAGTAVAAARDYARPAPPPVVPVTPAPVTPAPTTPATPRRVAPFVPARALRVARTGVTSVRVRCTGPALCRGTVRLLSAGKLKLGRAKARILTLGTASYSVRPGRTVAVRVVIPKAMRRVFTGARPRLSVRVVVQPRKGQGAVRRVVRPLVGSKLVAALR